MDEQPKTENDATDTSAAESVKISISEPEAANDQATPVINDITPPPAETSEETSPAPEADTPLVAEPPADEKDTQDAEAPIEEEVQAEPEEMPTEDSQPETPQPQASSQEEQVAPMATAEPAVMGVAASEMGKSSHRNNKKFAALITIFVAVLLAGVAVFVYMSTNKNAEEQNATNTPLQTQQKTVAPASVEDVDQTSEQVEEAVNSLDETEDFADSELSDSNLEL